MNEKKVVAIFGGSFNPPHVAHVLAVTLAQSIHDVDRVLVVPTYQHPFAKTLVPFDDRVRMCELAMAWIPNVEVSRVEEELGGESKTLRTVQHLAERHADWSLRLLIGADILAEAHKWYRFDEISRLAPPLVLGRGGVDRDDAPRPILPAISSTEIRAKLAARDLAGLEDVVPKGVLAYIASRGLYA